MNEFIFLVVVVKKESVQNWDSGPNDTPIFTYNTYAHLCNTQKEVDDVYVKNKYCEKITKYDCFKRG